MERTLINNKYINITDGGHSLVLNKESSHSLVIEGNSSILIDTLESESELILDIKKDASLRLSVLSKLNSNNVKIVANLEENAAIDVYFADFSIGKSKTKIEINLNEERASATWHLASLAATNDNKEFDVSIYHNSPLTYGKSDNYGVCKDDAKLVFSGISKIENGSIKSKTNQNAKIMVFDKASNAVAKPILKIDENDIEASHAAIVGKINDEHLFYLTSRGLSEAQAKELITFGYLKPILNGFDDENIKEEITKLIEGKM